MEISSTPPSPGPSRRRDRGRETASEPVAARVPSAAGAGRLASSTEEDRARRARKSRHDAFADHDGSRRRPMDPLTPKTSRRGGGGLPPRPHRRRSPCARSRTASGAELLRGLSEQRVRPPGSDTTRCYSDPDARALALRASSAAASRPSCRAPARTRGAGATSTPRCASCSATSGVSTPRSASRSSCARCAPTAASARR